MNFLQSHCLNFFFNFDQKISFCSEAPNHRQNQLHYHASSSISIEYVSVCVRMIGKMTYRRADKKSLLPLIRIQQQMIFYLVKSSLEIRITGVSHGILQFTAFCAKICRASKICESLLHTLGLGFLWLLFSQIDSPLLHC